MAGLWHLSNHQLHNPTTGKPYIGAKAFFYAADSNSPITVFKDYSLGTAHPNPVVASSGVFPAVFLDEEDGFYRFRITDANGVVISGADVPVIPIIGPGDSGGGAEVPVDADALFKTGDTKWRLGTGTHAGWIRLNGRTIGSATSGATERANSDTQALYEHCWNEFIDAICPVTGGRGVSAAADYAANKPLAVPDMRGRTLAGLDDMGTSAAGRLTSAVFSTSGQGPTVLGATAGAQRHTLAVEEMPSHDHSGATGADNAAHYHDIPLNSSNNQGSVPSWFLGTNAGANNNTTNPANAPHSHSISAQGGGGPHLNMQPTMLATLYARL